MEEKHLMRLVSTVSNQLFNVEIEKSFHKIEKAAFNVTHSKELRTETKYVVQMNVH